MASYRGAKLIEDLIRDSSLDSVQFYMQAIQNTAEKAVRDMLKEVHRRFNGQKLHAVDYMDCGTQIELNITIDPDTGDATFDFTGTDPQV